MFEANGSFEVSPPWWEQLQGSLGSGYDSLRSWGADLVNELYEEGLFNHPAGFGILAVVALLFAALAYLLIGLVAFPRPPAFHKTFSKSIQVAIIANVQLLLSPKRLQITNGLTDVLPYQQVALAQSLWLDQ